MVVAVFYAGSRVIYGGFIVDYGGRMVSNGSEYGGLESKNQCREKVDANRYEA